MTLEKLWYYGWAYNETLGNFAKSAPGVVISIIMGLIASYFFIAEKTHISEKFSSSMYQKGFKKWYITKHSLAYLS